MKKFIDLLAIFIALPINSIFTIYHGNEAQPHQFPYVVLVQSPQFFCSGTLISDRHVLTAAHCLMSIKTGGKAKVTVGAHEYRFGKTDGKLIYSNNFWIHENFSMPLAKFDIGLVELPDPLVKSEKIQWLKLSAKPDADLDVEDNEVVLAGWGYTENRLGIQPKLRYTKMNLLPLNACKAFKSHYIEDLNSNHICVKKNEGMPCSGDSGSSLVSTKTKNIVGILSYVKDAENGIDMGDNDCESPVPAVATRISSYIDWISEKAGIKFGLKIGHDNINEIALNSDDEVYSNVYRSRRWSI